jgi:hypothetical protein
MCVFVVAIWVQGCLGVLIGWRVKCDKCHDLQERVLLRRLLLVACSIGTCFSGSGMLIGKSHLPVLDGNGIR